MKVSRSKTPYKDGKPRFKIRKKPGVYMIYRNGKLVYVGYSSNNLYRTMYRHFQRWNDRTQVRVKYVANDERITVRVIYTNTAKQAAELERALILKYHPEDNPQQLITYEPTPATNRALNTFEGIYTYSGNDPF